MDGLAHLSWQADIDKLGADLIGHDDRQLVLVSILPQQARHLEQPRCALCIASCRSITASSEHAFRLTHAQRCLCSCCTMKSWPCQDAPLLLVGIHTLVADAADIQVCFSPGVHAKLLTRSSITWHGRDQP